MIETGMAPVILTRIYNLIGGLNKSSIFTAK
jgi:hypothetical protein